MLLSLFVHPSVRPSIRPQSQGPGLPSLLWNLASPHPTVPVCQCGAFHSRFRRLTNPAMQSGSLIADSFYGSWAHLCYHMQKGKKIPCFFPHLPLPTAIPN